MPLSLNEIKDRALAFSLEWEGAHGERAEAQTLVRGEEEEGKKDGYRERQEKRVT